MLLTITLSRSRISENIDATGPALGFIFCPELEDESGLICNISRQFGKGCGKL